jgi:hypothetical protein
MGTAKTSRSNWMVKRFVVCEEPRSVLVTADFLGRSWARQSPRPIGGWGQCEVAPSIQPTMNISLQQHALPAFFQKLIIDI